MTNKEIQTQMKEIYSELDTTQASPDACVEATAKIIQTMILADKIDEICDRVLKKIYR